LSGSSTFVRVRIEPSGVETRVRATERVLDALDDLPGGVPGGGLPMACRAGNCGACLVTVRHGAELFAAPDLAECDTLTAFGATQSGVRLACQLVVSAGVSGEAVLEVPAPPSTSKAHPG
jgi:ferredoxin